MPHISRFCCPLFCLYALCMAQCGGKADGASDGQAQPADSVAVVQYLSLAPLQGVWTDADSQAPFVWVRGDSAYYTEAHSLPVAVRLSADSLWLGQEAYLVEQRSQYSISLQTHTGHSLELHRSDNADDSLLFMLHPAEPPVYSQVTTRDTVTYCGERRLHCYATVNPTTRRVYRTTYSAEGMAMEQYSYDNVIHLSVYEGKKCLFRRNFEKADFAAYIPQAFMQQAILSDITFGHTDAHGPHFYALVCIPEGSACYMVEIAISPEGEYQMELRDF